MLKEYRERQEEWNRRASTLEEVTAARDKAKAHHDKLGQDRFDKFMQGFNNISNKLKEMYQVRQGLLLSDELNANCCVDDHIGRKR